MARKRGEENPSAAKGVATIVMVIAFAMALYILLIPPEDRQALIEGDLTSDDKDTVDELTELLTESPGLMSPRQETGTAHSINNINLFIKNEPELIPLVDALEVKKALFAVSAPTLSFDAPNRENIKTANIYFTTSKPKGTLKAELNGQQFYAKAMDSAGIKVIEIPVNYLQERNQITLEVSSPGLLFWRTNKYELSDVGIRLEYELINAKESRIFAIPQEELDDLSEARLSYFMICNAPLEQGVTNLRILLNNDEILDSHVQCVSTHEEIELEKSHFQPGNNQITFILEEGEFSFNQVKVETKSDEFTYPTYFFTITASQWEDINEEDEEVTLTIYLDDEEDHKNARLIINDETIFMKTQEPKVEYDITDLVERGTNFIRITPTTTFTMTGLKVTLE